MLEKLTGNHNIEKLRIIMLFEANFNHNNKWLGQAMMRLTEEQNLIAPNNMAAKFLKQPAPNA